MDSLTLGAVVLEWHKDIDRSLPWKQNSSPYKIWISEIILQQTQVLQGLRYYSRFIEQYPTVHALASSSEGDLLKSWEGLGYNSRARNLHKSAKLIVEEYGGDFPKVFQEILSLPGIGDYTASAISAFAYEHAHVAVDSNVERWVSRYYGIAHYKSSPQLKKAVKSLLTPYVESHTSPAECNQSFIDFGALVCTAKKPICGQCPLADSCYAYGQHKTADYPLSKPKKPRKVRYLHYLVGVCEEEVPITKRVAKDIWQGMYELPIYESESAVDLDANHLAEYFNLKGPLVIDSVQSYEQTLTHRIIKGKFYLCKLSAKSNELGQWMSRDEIINFAFAGIVRLFLADNMSIFNANNK